MDSSRESRKIRRRWMRRSLLLFAFVFGFFASWIALDPLGTGAWNSEFAGDRKLASDGQSTGHSPSDSTLLEQMHLGRVGAYAPGDFGKSGSPEGDAFGNGIPNPRDRDVGVTGEGWESGPDKYYGSRSFENRLGRSKASVPWSDPFPEPAGDLRKPSQASGSDSDETSAVPTNGHDDGDPKNGLRADPIEVEDLKFSTDRTHWNGRAQLLPNPMFVEQLAGKRANDIRGGGWVVIDSVRGEVHSVELFKSETKKYTSRRAVEAKFSDESGRQNVNTVNTGFPIARGIPGVLTGKYEVPETPRCLVRYSIVMSDEHCNVPRGRAAGGPLKFKFEAPLVHADSLDSEFKFTTVYFEDADGDLQEVGTFNENFMPIGDVNRDGYPDFYAESVTESNESGRHDLIMSRVIRDEVDYVTYSSRFLGR